MAHNLGHTIEELFAPPQSGPTPEENANFHLTPEGRVLQGQLDAPDFTPENFADPRFAPFVSFAENSTSPGGGPLGFFNPPGAGVSQGFLPEVPADLAGIPGIGGSVQEYFDYIKSFGPEGISPGVLADIVQTEANRRKLEEARGLALDTLGGTRDRVTGELEAFQDDPQRQLITRLLQERATTPQFGEQERSAAHLALAQGAAIAKQQAATSAAGRGVGGGGLQRSIEAGLSTATVAEGLRFDVKFNALNRQANDRAAELLGRFETSGNQLELAYSNELTAIDDIIVGLELDVPLTEIDFLAFEALQFGKEVFEANEAYRQASLEAFEKANEWTWNDDIATGIDFIAAGGLQLLGGVSDLIFGGGDDGGGQLPHERANDLF